MKNILLPTDFSMNSLNAMHYAIELFREEKCKFYLLHTYTPVVYDPEILIQEKTDYVLEFVEKELDQLIRDLKEIAGKDHDFEKIASFSVLTSAINEVVADKEVYMVVMGTKGATGAREILWGSNTVHALKSIKCPLLIIPEKYTSKKPKHILFPTDFNFNYPLSILKVVRDICSLNEAKLHVLHMLTDHKIKHEISNHKKLLAQELKKVDHTFHTIEARSLVNAILQFEEDFDIDLLVMVNNKRSFFRNLLFSSPVNKIGFRTRNPFLVLPTHH